MARHEVQALWALAAGELDAAARARVEAHVAGCPSCSAQLEQVKQSRGVLHEARAVTPDVRWGVVDAGLRSEAARRMTAAAPRSRLPWALALAGACAAMLGFWMLRTPEVAPGGPGVPVATLPASQTGTAVATAQAVLEGGSAPDTAQAESTSGAVVREVGGTERALQTGAKLRSGVAVRTPARSTALLRLPDASRVRLSEGSDVELSRAEARDVHLTVRQGRLSVQASHAERQGFTVEAAGLRVSVVGTVFTVERTEHGAAVAVAEGQVRVEVEGQPTRLVGAGERVELDARERTLKHEPVSEPDQRAFEALSAPVPQQGDTATTAEAIAAVAPTTDAPSALTADAVAPAALATEAPSAKKPAVATQPKSRGERQQVATTVPRAGGKPRERVASATPTVAPPAPEKTVVAAPPAPAPVVVAAAPPVTGPDQEFAPYPARSVTESLPPKTAPAPVPPPVAVAEAPAKEKKKKEPLIPMALMSKDADERFLGYARLQLSPRTCESFLVGLEEIAQRSPRDSHREQARYLRARCFEEKLQPKAAKGEYRQYLNEFPRGRYAREANTALLP
ncbi:FecR domain-containing protein [Pyxidicoccus trucidator]|uniref:FecR domain-containing protein n=1 Tax=Pyxidicoccus trucidator TaxID=2709662 RepID=UPI0013DC59DE|nr:FecR domain-containing protein [Pyxidicoccus trucidator]